MDRYIPDVTIKRLPSYFRVLHELAQEKIDIVSSAEMGRRTGFSSEQVRKDLAYFGAFGTRGVGYEVAHLRRRIRSILGLDNPQPVVLVGAGNLGRALAHYNRENQDDLTITHIFDVDEQLLGKKVAGIEVLHVDRMREIIDKNQIQMAIVTVPSDAAREVVDSLAGAGISAILNFAPGILQVPENVVLKSLDLTSELQSLAYYCRKR